MVPSLRAALSLSRLSGSRGSVVFQDSRRGRSRRPGRAWFVRRRWTTAPVCSTGSSWPASGGVEEVTREDVDRVVAGRLDKDRRQRPTRLCQTFRGSTRSCPRRKAGEIEAAFGSAWWRYPVDGSTPHRHADSSSPSATAPPSRYRMEEFSTSSRTCRWGPVVRGGRRDRRDVRTLYLAALRAEEMRRWTAPTCTSAAVRSGRSTCFRQGGEDLGPRPRLGADAHGPRPDPGLVSR